MKESIDRLFELTKVQTRWHSIYIAWLAQFHSTSMKINFEDSFKHQTNHSFSTHKHFWNSSLGWLARRLQLVVDSVKHFSIPLDLYQDNHFSSR